MALLILLRQDSGARNCFLGESSGPYFWGRRNVLRGVGAVKGGREGPVCRWGLLVPAGPGLGLWLGGTAEAVPFPFAPRRTLWEGRTVGEQQIPRFARNDNV